MNRKQTIERLIYALVIILSLAVLGLAVCSPGFFKDNKAVYQGF